MLISVCVKGISIPASAKASRIANERSVRTLTVLLMSSMKTYRMKLRLYAPNSLRSTTGSGVCKTSGLLRATFSSTSLTWRGLQA
jgi:hypothetical protein